MKKKKKEKRKGGGGKKKKNERGTLERERAREADTRVQGNAKSGWEEEGRRNEYERTTKKGRP